MGGGFSKYDYGCHQIVDPILIAHVILDADARMIQARDGFCFALEPLLANRITRKLRCQNLEGYRPLQPRVAGAVDFAHAPGTESRADFIESMRGSGNGRLGQSRYGFSLALPHSFCHRWWRLGPCPGDLVRRRPLA